MHNEYGEYNLYGLLKIKSNINEIKSSLSYFLSVGSFEKQERVVSITVDVKDRISIEKNTLDKIGDFYYNRPDDIFYYDHPFFFPAQFSVQGLSAGNITINVTEWFLRLPTILRGGINFIYLFREIMLLKLIELGYVLFHSACIDFEGQGTIITAFPNTGKTYISFGLVKGSGAKLLSDEYTFVDSDLKIKSFFGISALGPKIIKEFNIQISKREDLILKLCKLRAALLPFLFEPIIWIHSTRIFPKQERKEESQLKNIIFLERGKREVKILDKKETFKKLTILTDNEFPFVSNYFLQAYSYINKDFDLSEFQEKQRQIISGIVNNTNKAMVLSFTPGDIKGISELIKGYIQY